MRIAIVTETFLPNVNGITRMLVEYLSYLRAHGHEAIVFAPGEGEHEVEGYEIVRVSGAPFPLYPELTLAPFSLRMGRILRSWKPDLMHLAGPFVLGQQGLNLARSMGVPVAAHYQTDIARYARHFGLGALENLAWRRLLDLHNACDVNFAPTASIAHDLRQRGMRHVHVCGRGVDNRQFNPAFRDTAWRSQIIGERDRPILLFVGRVSPEKNLSTLMAVARALPEYPLVVVGDGPARGSLAQSLAGLDVHFTGTLQGQELARAYASSDIFLFPSATETFGQVVREAMASGLPVIGARAGGVQDLITDGVTGSLCQPEDTAAFIAATQRLATTHQLRQEQSRAARLEATNYTWEAVFNRLMGWYAGLVSPREQVPTLVGNR